MTEKGIDVTPTWESLMPVLIDAAAQGNAHAVQELTKLARIVDAHIAELGKLEAEHAERACVDCGVRGGSHAFGCSHASTLGDH